jgi:hypothetical protein
MLLAMFLRGAHLNGLAPSQPLSCMAYNIERSAVHTHAYCDIASACAILTDHESNDDKHHCMIHQSMQPWADGIYVAGCQ